MQHLQRNKTCWDNRIKVKLEIRNGYFLLTKGFKGRNQATSSSTQFLC